MPAPPPPSSAAPSRFRQGFHASVVAVGLLGWIYLFQHWGAWWQAFTAQPQSLSNLWSGWGYALLHGSPTHLMANGLALLVLGTLAYGLYPNATVRACHCPGWRHSLPFGCWESPAPPAWGPVESLMD